MSVLEPGGDDAPYGATPRNVEAYVQQDKIRTIHFGIGAIGAEIVRTVLNNPEIEIVAAVDTHPAKVGRDLGDAAGVGHQVGVTVSYETEPILRDVYADVVIHTTGSSLTDVYPQLMAIATAEKSVISSCEELSFPWTRYPEISHRLDRKARESGVRILGSGVNPGFVMDLLPLVLATASDSVKSVKVTRVVDVSTRRVQLQRKTGVGLSVKGFEQGAGGGSIGHVGLRESLLMVADTLGWNLDDVTETIAPVIAKDKMASEYFSVERGIVAGLTQSAVGTAAGKEVIRLDLEMSLSAKNPRDEIEIEGRPPIHVIIPNGIAGDVATASIMSNCIPAMARSRNVGLLTMRDLPLIPYYQPKRLARDPFELTA